MSTLAHDWNSFLRLLHDDPHQVILMVDAAILLLFVVIFIPGFLTSASTRRFTVPRPPARERSSPVEIGGLQVLAPIVSLGRYVRTHPMIFFFLVLAAFLSIVVPAIVSFAAKAAEADLQRADAPPTTLTPVTITIDVPRGRHLVDVHFYEPGLQDQADASGRLPRPLDALVTRALGPQEEPRRFGIHYGSAVYVFQESR